MRGAIMYAPGDVRVEDRQKLALQFGATDIVTERGDEGVVELPGHNCTLHLCGPVFNGVMAAGNSRVTVFHDLGRWDPNTPP